MKTASQSKPLAITAWAMQIILAVVFVLMGAFPKLSGDVYSVALFEKLGFEPGRFIVGGAEAIAAVLLLVPGAHAVGGALVVGLMLGAIGSHLGPLGIDTELMINGEPETLPQLFPMSIVFLVLALALVALRRDELPLIGAKANSEA